MQWTQEQQPIILHLTDLTRVVNTQSGELVRDVLSILNHLEVGEQWNRNYV
ncbi:hypothetical protein C4K03_0843 [Pseudomonas synxantha]|uniref:Uncharacterized protein n=1 Tax=Pseudomonas synxantha TaxID=47883 RepID=A0A3G7U3E2_9PSED|nr:hypothetical protein C4K03_0843 [Pseudomonas synxantha]